MKWIIVNTYKTKPEEEGWYIANVYKKLFWETLNGNLNTNYSHENTQNTYSKEFGYGYIREKPEIMFYDLLKNHENNVLENTKDDILFEHPELKNKFISGAKKLIQFLDNFNDFIRVGLVGYNTAGIFKLCLENKNLNDNTLKQIKYQNNYGLCNDIYINEKTEFFLLENITSRYYQSREIYLKGWHSFWII